ncbi:NAD(P)H-dependent flavin oxidoreductase [Mycobacterium sp. pW049]|uniref:NAD(P)H-dependent flavin oxidoreductase n=1 Tax=[Mycobacterium] bulgaricum TaxID=3238985 RepID=UPI00351BE355
METIATRWSAAMNLNAPIVNAPMGGAAGGLLAAAVSRAGGLGMIGSGSSGSAEQLKAQLRQLGDIKRPFGIGFIEWVVEKDTHLLDTALEARPALLAVSFGEDWEWVGRARDAGCVTATQVADLESAQRAVDAGVQVLVARGSEAGGHGTPAVSTLPLLAAVLDRVDVPVLAAGGIASGRALAAVLAAGASGAWIGTAFAACRESLLSDAARQVLVDARAGDTLNTRVFDVALGYPWPEHLPERVIRNAFTEAWDGRTPDEQARAQLREAIAADDFRVAPVNAGQGVGDIDAVETAAAVIERLTSVRPGS